MLYGLTGSSGTGKTTLARTVAESLSAEFVATSITASGRRHGYDPVGLMSLQDRIKLQHHLLDDLVELIKNAKRPAIMDRTPIDLIGYMYAEIDMHSHLRLSQVDIARIEAYRQRCLDETVRWFDHVFVTTPLPVYETAETRPVANAAYQQHSQMIMEASIYSLTGRVNFSILRPPGLETRVEHVHDTIVARMNIIDRQRRGATGLH
jgi:predicted ATPase